jgi:phospholipid/cholesterol/gamma-HCH transport system substrate-binding protein
MNTRNIEISVGLFVFIGLAAVAFLAVRIGGGRLSLSAPTTQLTQARFTNASGLKSGSTVRVAGVPIGTVTEVTLKHDEMVALVTLKIDSTLKLDDDTSAAVRSSGLIGEKFISLKPGSSGTALKPGAIIVDTESAVDLEDIISRFAFGSVDKK